jgi:hypothetical protein
MQDRPSDAGITKDVIKSLAQVHGVNIPDDRLDSVLKQYQNYLETLRRLESLPIGREAEPEIIYSLRQKR